LKAYSSWNEWPVSFYVPNFHEGLYWPWDGLGGWIKYTT
jgi:hypothetical protein